MGFEPTASSLGRWTSTNSQCAFLNSWREIPISPRSVRGYEGLSTGTNRVCDPSCGRKRTRDVKTGEFTQHWKQRTYASKALHPDHEKLRNIRGVPVVARCCWRRGTYAPLARLSIVRCMISRVNGTLYAFFARGVAPASAVSAIFAVSSGVIRCPARRSSAADTRQGIGATPPSTTRAERHTSLSISSTMAALTTAWVQASRSRTL